MTLSGFFYNFFWAPAKLIFTFFLYLKIETKENLKKIRGPLIIASNHNSWTDPFLISVAFPRASKVFPIHYACWYKYYYFPLFFPFVWAFGAFSIRKGIGLKKSLETPLRILKKGGVIGIFPEGTRHKRERPNKGKRGPAFLAIKTGAKILPVKIEGNTNMSFWKCLLRRYKVKIKFGKTFRLPPKKINSIEDYNKPANFIMERIREL